MDDNQRSDYRKQLSMLAVVLCLLVQVVAPTFYVSAAESTPFSVRQICKGAIAVLMGRDSAGINAQAIGDEVWLSYTRSDGTSWKFKCKLDGARILWGSDTGRWRIHPQDERLSFSVVQTAGVRRLQVEQRFSDGSSNKRAFSREQLGP